MDKYQIMPPLTDQEYQELKDSIAQHGVQVAVEYDEDGNILDGHHRVQICRELGISNIPRIVKVGMDENQKLDYAVMINATRRQLKREQKQELIRQQLRRTPEKSDRQIAGMVGTSNSTVSETRKNMVESGQLCDSHSSIGADGRIRTRPCKPVSLYQPKDDDIDIAKDLTATAAPELVTAVAEGKVPLMQAFAVADGASQDEQKEALRRLESGDVPYLMEGLNQQRIEQYYRITPAERMASEERVRKADTEIDRQCNIAKAIHKAIYEPACLDVSDIETDIRFYLESLPSIDMDVELMTLNRAIEKLQKIKIALIGTNKLRVVK